MMDLLPFLMMAIQESPEAALAHKCDTQISWITDGVELKDGTPKPSLITSEDRLKLLERALDLARDRKRLILWYCMRVPGTHTYRAAILDTYMRAVFFTDPSLVELVREKFIPLRMACDEAVSARTGIRFPGFIEPGLILLSPDGKIVHVIDRIRTFNADWMRAALVSVLRREPECNAPVGPSVGDLLRGGDDDQAWEKATPDQRALIYRHAGRFREILDLPCAPLQKGIAHLGLQQLDQALAILRSEDSAEGLYYLAATQWWSGKDPVDLWKKLVHRYPESPWAWKAALNLVRGKDGLPQGPMTHLYENPFFRPPPEVPSSTREPGTDPDRVAARAIEFLVRAQRPEGGWCDARYSYGWAGYVVRERVSAGLLDPSYSTWPDPELHPNLYMAITALSALALSEWRELAPASIDRAIGRAQDYLADDGRLAPGKCELCYADAYRLMFFARQKDAPRMNRIVRRLSEEQDRDGFWGHEYPSAFATAAVLRSLHLARDAGAEVPEALLGRAAQALLLYRGEGGRQPYRHEIGKGPSSEKNSMGRAASCELALYQCGKGSLKEVSTGVEAYFRHLPRLEAVRTCDNHADEELAGFFYFNVVFHTLEAARSLPEPLRGECQARFRAQILAIPEWDGSFVDSHELGKSYGTAMALLILRRLR